MRLIIDTNILISALLNPHSNAATLLDQWEMGRFRVITCEQQLEEFARVTRYPKIQERITPSAAGLLLNQFRKVAVTIDDVPSPSVSRDHHDDWMFGLAHKSGAEFIVSGDRQHVLEIGKYHTTRIVALADILDLLHH